jgi:hypothetical protein
MNGNGYRNSSGGLSIPPIYLYIGIGILAVIIISVIGGLLSAGVQAYFAVAAGALLVLANLRDLLSGAGSSAALMNTMVGAGLIFFFLGSAFGWVWYIPAHCCCWLRRLRSHCGAPMCTTSTWAPRARWRSMCAAPWAGAPACRKRHDAAASDRCTASINSDAVNGFSI